jgi:HlyD family secretion protein
VNSRPGRRRDRWRWILPLGVVLAAAAVLGSRVVQRHPESAIPIQTEPATHRTLTVTVEGTGTVEPIDIVEIKSKASGQIVSMPVEVGSTVKAGDLLVQIDKRDVQNQYDQSLAALQAARTRVQITAAQRQRADTLFAQQVITVDEHETATMAAANAESDVVTARTNLDLAQQRLEDATVRAPIAGTVIEQLASAGQVISSATSSASGGTTILRMADLTRIQVRTLVSETDIGQVHPGQPATVSVDAFPDQPCTGTIVKIEPQAVVQQSITMFPVLVSLANEKRQLLPGMNGEITVTVAHQDDALSVPIDAVRSARELPALATALGVDAATVRGELAAQPSRWHGRAPGDSLAAGRRRRSRGAGGPDSGGPPPPPPEAADDRDTTMRGANTERAVLVQTDHGIEARLVRVGLSNFDYAEVLAGVQEGERVVLLSVAEVQAKRSSDQTRIRQRMSSSMPGAPPAGGPPGGGGGGR